jgi:N-formylmaleamate deformylase
MISRFMFAAMVVAASIAIEARAADPYHVDIQGQGRPVYLIPGLASPGEVWDDLAVHLRSQGYQTRVLTLAGFAGQPPMAESSFLPVVHQALAEQLMDHQGSKPLVIGHSLGGFMAFWLAATVPDSLSGMVAIDGVPYLGALSDPEATPESNAAQAEQLAGFMSSLSADQYAAQNRMALGGMVSSEEEIERLAAAGSLSDPGTVGRAVAEMLTIDIRPMLGDIRVPVVLIQAADSGAMEAAHAAYAGQVEGIENVRHVVASRGRHFVQIDDPGFVIAEVDRLLEEIESGEY